MENRPEAADEPPTNQAEEDATKLPTEGRPTNEPPIDWAEEDATKPETEERTAEALNEGPTTASTDGYPEAEGERYAAMKAAPPRVLSVGDGAQRPARIS